MASVNLDEDGHVEVMVACRAAAVGIEAGHSSAEDVAALVASGFADDVVRALVEDDHDRIGA